MIKMYVLGLLLISSSLCGMQQGRVKTQSELDAEQERLQKVIDEKTRAAAELGQKADESRQAFMEALRAMNAEAREEAPINGESSNLSCEELKRRADESTRAFMAEAAHAQSQSQTQADSKSAAAAQEADSRPSLSEQQNKFIEDLQKRFHASKLKKELWDNIVKNLQREGNNNFSPDDIEDAFELFAEAFGELAYEGSRQATLDVQAELNRCRGSYVGGFCYSFYKPSWRWDIEAYHRRKYVSAASLKSIGDLARKRGKEMAEACAVLNALEKDLMHNNLRNFHKFCMEADDLHRTAASKFARIFIKNRNRVIVGVAAIVAIACVIYKKTRSDY
jgi:hypothetical protein